MGRNPDNRSGHQVFEILAREHADMLTAYLRSLVTRQEMVDDLFQETMLTAWRRLDDYDRARPFGPWLRGIAARLVLRARRLAAGEMLSCDPAVLEVLENRFATLHQLPGDSLRGRLERLSMCLKRLPERLREAIELAYVRELLIRQVARQLKASEEAVKKRVQRGRQLLAECLRSAEVKT